jgi:hypothetical protein
MVQKSWPHLFEIMGYLNVVSVERWRCFSGWPTMSVGGDQRGLLLGSLLFTRSWNMDSVRRPSSTPSQNRRWNMWLDGWKYIDECV